uniref:hypothetical protein n=1 Tax=Nocardia farcinica TaxID=37329 RepID=UPI002456580D
MSAVAESAAGTAAATVKAVPAAETATHPTAALETTPTEPTTTQTTTTETTPPETRAARPAPAPPPPPPEGGGWLRCASGAVEGADVPLVLAAAAFAFLLLGPPRLLLSTLPVEGGAGGGHSFEGRVIVRFPATAEVDVHFGSFGGVLQGEEFAV